MTADPTYDDEPTALELSAVHDIGAERATLGSCMLSIDALAEVAEALAPADFYRPAHEIVFSAIMRMFTRGEVIDAITVADELTHTGDLRRVGGHAFLHDLVQSVPTTANAAYYANIVAERAVLRRLAEACTQSLDDVRQGHGGVENIVAKAQAAILAVQAQRNRSDYLSINDIFTPTLDEIEAASGRGGEMTGVPSGFIDLDEVTHGFQPGQMIIIAARPALGKSTAAVDIAREAAFRHDMCTVLFSLEMSRTEIGMRTISAEGTIPLHALRKGMLTDNDWGKISNLVGTFSTAPLYVDDSPNVTMAEIRTKCRRLKQQNNLRLVIIDYLQLMRSPGKVESRQQEVSEFSRSIKLLAKELDVPVVVVAQLNRGPEQRTDKKPTMSDLRESGSLEQDADMVMLIHRPEMGDPDSPRAGEADFILAKHRNGPTKTITVAFQGHYSRFTNMMRVDL